MFGMVNRGRAVAAVVVLGAACVATVVCWSSVGAEPPMLPTIPFGGLSAYTVGADVPGGAAGYVFYTSGLSAASLLPATDLLPTHDTNVIATKSGQVVWTYRAPSG